MQMFDLYAVEASTNLAEWTRLALLLRTNNNPHPLLFQDTNAVFLQIRGADHMTPGDTGWTVEIPQGRRPALTFDDCAVWLFDTYLKGEAPPFPTNAEIYNVQTK